MDTIFNAHINKDTGAEQTIKEHSESTAKLCREFAISEMQDCAEAAGMTHDLGKYQQPFQRRLKDEKIRVEHSTCGAIVAKETIKGPMGTMIAYCIAGHHGGLPDGGFTNDPNEPTLKGRLQRKFDDYSAYKNEIAIPEVDIDAFKNFLAQDCNNDIDVLIDKFAFLTRYCFSCLTDADTLDTIEFCNDKQERKLMVDFAACLKKVNARLDAFICQTELQKSRRLLQEQTYSKVSTSAELFLMNMPTGSGKTICSVKFALEKAVREHKKRIIYIIPYNSIIDQTVDDFEKIFGKDAEILRHQSSFSYEDEEGKEKITEDYRDAAKNAVENWDAPFIITTSVQFFESVYSHKKKKLRKLHNMADSILIFDEAHLMPQKYLQPCLQAVTYITKYLNSSAVFLTATMPDFPKLIRQYALPSSQIVDLIDDRALFTNFKKCSYRFCGEITKESLLKEARKNPTALIIVNRKMTANELYKACPGKRYHLSTYMAACDRTKIIEAIKNDVHRLEQDFPNLEDVPEERKITVISTSLIEAGVDLDIYRVFRELTGLDSILQSGGRCNREGKRLNAETWIFCLSDEDVRVSNDERINLTKGLIEKYSDISVPECIKEYYDRLYFMKADEIKKNTISKQCHHIDDIPFRSYGEQFRLIDTPTISVVVERDEESLKLIKLLAATGKVDTRKLQKYSCTVSRRDLDSLISQHVVEDYGSGIWCLTNLDYYDENVGIKFEAPDYYM